jgi:RHS repeat-associated protein
VASGTGCHHHVIAGRLNGDCQARPQADDETRRPDFDRRDRSQEEIKMNEYLDSNLRNAGRRASLLLYIAAILCVPSIASAQQPANKFNYSRTTDYTYTANGRLDSKTVEKDTAALCSTTTFGYDAYGNTSALAVANCAGASGRAAFATRQATLRFASQSARSCPGQPAPAILPQSGAFPTLGTNALGHQVSATFDPRFGSVTSVAEANCLTSTSAYDDFGRVIQQTSPDGTSRVISYCYLPAAGRDLSSNSATCPAPAGAEIPANAIGFVHSEPRSKSNVKNGPFSRVYLNAAGASIRNVTEGFDGAAQAGGTQRLVVKDTEFSSIGMPVIETEPYFLDSGASVAANSGNTYGMSKTEYDLFGRPVSLYSTDPKGSIAGMVFGTRGSRQAALTQVRYTGLNTTVTNDMGQQRTEEGNIDGQLVRVTDAYGGQIVYQYDAFGNAVKTKDPLQNLIAIDFDILGRKTLLNDPDTGIQKFDYNALGELVWQQSPNQREQGQSTTFVMDALGRTVSRVEPEFTSVWSYDRYADGSACAAGIGRLCETTSSNGISEKAFFDGYGRQFQSRRKIANGPTFTTVVTFDADQARVATKTYPSGLRVTYGYTARLGFLDSIANGASTLWRARSLNAWGRLEQEVVGNGVQTNTVFEPQTGRTKDIGAGPGNTVFHHSYDYDSLANLRSRDDSNGAGNGHAVTETYLYDNLSRLQTYSISGPDMAAPMTRRVDLSYDAVGNLTYKSDVGIYTYPTPGSAKPHAVTSIAGGAANSYAYDLNGNLTTAAAGKYKKINYTSFDLPDGSLGIEGRDGTRYSWQYNADHARIKEVRANAQGTRTTWISHPDNAGGLGFEQEISAAGAVANRHYLDAGGMTIGMITTNGAITNPDNPQPTDASAVVAQIAYWHKDQLGSISAITDTTGAVTQRMAYDPFGKRRNVNGSYDAAGAIVIDNPEGTDRGFTGHEEMDDIGIVHMNGRIYDANIGRVMQADPLVQAPEDMQSFNRYSYVMNNPLNLTDPSGYAWYWSQKNWRRFKAWLTRQDVKVQYNSNPSAGAGGSSSGGQGGNGQGGSAGGCANGAGGSSTTGGVYSGGCSTADGGAGSNSGTFNISVSTNGSSPATGHRPVTGGNGPGATIYSGTAVTGEVKYDDVSKWTHITLSGLGTVPAFGVIPDTVDLAYTAAEYPFGKSTGTDVALAVAGVAATVGPAILDGPAAAAKISARLGKFSRGCKCFVAGTLVHTEFGLKRIELIKVGDKVMSRSEETGETSWKPVIKLVRNNAKSSVTIHYVDDQGLRGIFRVTPEHPFMLEGNVWIPAGKLESGNKMLALNGKLIVEGIDVSNIRRKTFNFEVEDFHTYFVGAKGAWVHNAGPCPVIWKGFEKGKLEEHFGKHVIDQREFGNITQNQYNKLAREFASETGDFLEQKVGNFWVKYDPATNRAFIGYLKTREIRSFYKPDGRTGNAFQELIDNAIKIGGGKL